jgi:rRNA maturation protein Nop10
MTVRELEPIAESIKTFLEKVDPLTLDTTAEYRLSRNAKFCDQALKQSVDSQSKLFTRFVKKDKKGQPVQVTVKRLDPESGEEVTVPIPNRFELDNPEEYNTEIEKVKDEAVDEIKWMKVPISLLKGAKGPKGPLFYNGDAFIVDDTEVSE